MGIIDGLGPDTVSRLERSARSRLDEAEYLARGGFNLAAIYLYGYSAEMRLGAAYFKLLGLGATDEIGPARLASVLRNARLLSRAKDRSHPLDGLARLLVQDKAPLSGLAYAKGLGEGIIDRADRVAEDWGPKLRYRSIAVPVALVEGVRDSAAWLSDNYHRM